jgi:putative membrane protein
MAMNIQPSGQSYQSSLFSPMLHEGEPIAPHDLPTTWNGALLIWLGLVLFVALYAYGTWRCWRRAGYGRGIAPWQVLAYTSACTVLVVALLSPLDAVAGALFSAHMAQHSLLMLLAAPLLVLSNPLLAIVWATPQQWRRGFAPLARLGRMQGLLPFAWLVHALALWFWHIPAFYELALESEAIHALEHGCFLGTALLFWWAVLHRRRGEGWALLPLFTMAVQSSLLGGLILAARTPWYQAYGNSTLAWGLRPLEDQQLAGLWMLLPGDAVYLLALLALAGRLLLIDRHYLTTDQADQADLHGFLKKSV